MHRRRTVDSRVVRRRRRPAAGGQYADQEMRGCTRDAPATKAPQRILIIYQHQRPHRGASFNTAVDYHHSAAPPLAMKGMLLNAAACARD